MPFVDTKINVKVSKEQEIALKSKLGEVIELIPGKSENWLMVGIQDDYHMYFRGDDSQPIAFVEVRCFGSPDKAAFRNMTARLSEIYGELFGVSPNHMYVKYSATMDWGWNGDNF